jgi:hypothetical protein
MNGSAFIAASNPTLDASGKNVFPAVDKITLSGSSAGTIYTEAHPTTPECPASSAPST